MDLFLFSCLGLAGSGAAIPLGSWLFLYLLSLRTQYSLQGKHILVRRLAVPSSARVAEGVAADFISACVSFITLLSRLQEEVYSGIGKADARESLKRGAALVTILARDKVRPFVP